MCLRSSGLGFAATCLAQRRCRGDHGRRALRTATRRALGCAATPLPLDRRSTGVQIRAEVERLGVQEGTVNVLSRHTTTAVTINECEPRLLDDIRQASAPSVRIQQG